MKISTPLKIALVQEGMKQRQLADAVQVHESLISDLCRGRRNPDERLAEKISLVLGIPTGALFPEMRRAG